LLNIAIVDCFTEEALLTKNAIEQIFEERNEGVNVKIFSESLDFVSDYVPKFDLVLFEVDLPHVDGISLAKKLRKIDSGVAIAFITRNERGAVHGYEINALEYILKPIEKNQFFKKFNAVIKRIKQAQSKKISVTVNGDLRCFLVKDVCYVEVTGHHLVYHLRGEDVVCRGNLGEIEKLLLDENFTRIYKSFLINLAYVEKISAKTVVVNGDELLLSRSKRKEFLQEFNEFILKCGLQTV